MKKKTSFLLLFAIMFLVGCRTAFPKIESFYVSPFELTSEEKLFRATMSLNPDGTAIAIGYSFNLVDIESGERINLYETFDVRNKITLANHDLLADYVFWSFDGRYLGAQAKHYEPTSKDPVGRVFYRFDLQTKTAERHELWVSAFSPFDSNQVLTENGVYNLKDDTIIPYFPEYDFRQEEEFGATNSITGILWSKELGIPVAQLSISSPNKIESNVVLQSLDIEDPTHPKYSIPIGFSYEQPDWAIYRRFDPTGEFALIVQWLCSKELEPCAAVPVNTNSVYDTVLILVRWRTQERQELIRLSEIDPEHVVAYGYMDWSADGSTIFISRKDAPPIVLKVK